MSEGSEFDEVSNWSGATPRSETSLDTIQDLMRRFTLDYRPDYTLKIRSRLAGLILGADVTHSPLTNKQSGAIVAKPSNPLALWRRLKLDTLGTVTLRSRKLRWWLLTLDLEAQANPRLQTSNLSFRVATKWDMYRGQIRNKKRVPLGSGAEARVHYSVNYNLPEIEGNLKTAERGIVKQDVTADVGYAHGEIPRMELVFWPQLIGRSGTTPNDFKRRREQFSDLDLFVSPLEEPPFPVIHAPPEASLVALPPAPVAAERTPASESPSLPVSEGLARDARRFLEVAGVHARATAERIKGWTHAGATALAKVTEPKN